MKEGILCTHKSYVYNMDTDLVVYSAFLGICSMCTCRHVFQCGKLFPCDVCVCMAKKSLLSSTISICWIWLKTHFGLYSFIQTYETNVSMVNMLRFHTPHWRCHQRYRLNKKVTKQWINVQCLRSSYILYVRNYAHNSNKSQFPLKNHELKVEVWKSMLVLWLKSPINILFSP